MERGGVSIFWLKTLGDALFLINLFLSLFSSLPPRFWLMAIVLARVLGMVCSKIKLIIQIK